MKQIQYGGIDFARMSISTLADIVPSLYILEMPYLYGILVICGRCWMEK